VLTGGQVDGDRPSEEVGGKVDLCRPAAAGDANRLILRLFFLAPAAERWALTQVLSTATVPPRWPAETSASSMFCQILRRDQRLKRL